MSYESKNGKYRSYFYYVPEEIIAWVENQLYKNPVAVISVAYADYYTIFDICTWLESEHWVTKWDQKGYKIYAAKTHEAIDKWIRQ